MPEVLYRYDYYCSSDGYVEVRLEKHKIVAETPKGYWIGKDWAFTDLIEKERWVSKDGRKRFAYPTKEEALNSFLIRKHKQLIHIKRKEGMIKRAIELAEELKEDHKNGKENTHKSFKVSSIPIQFITRNSLLP